MALTLAILGALSTLIPVLVEVWRANTKRADSATKAIRDRDRAELRAALERLRLLRQKGSEHDKPLLPPGGSGV